MPPIISLACSEDHADKLCAIATLRGIASDPDTRIKIVEEGGLDTYTSFSFLQHNTCPVCRSPLTSEAVQQRATADAQATATQDLQENPWDLE